MEVSFTKACEGSRLKVKHPLQCSSTVLQHFIAHTTQCDAVLHWDVIVVSGIFQEVEEVPHSPSSFGQMPKAQTRKNRSDSQFTQSLHSLNNEWKRTHEENAARAPETSLTHKRSEWGEPIGEEGDLL